LGRFGFAFIGESKRKERVMYRTMSYDDMCKHIERCSDVVKVKLEQAAERSAQHMAETLERKCIEDLKAESNINKSKG
jgi:orotidine-5'-phosphate decarboxylase